jgi:hypothetical protein
LTFRPPPKKRFIIIIIISTISLHSFDDLTWITRNLKSILEKIFKKLSFSTWKGSSSSKSKTFIGNVISFFKWFLENQVFKWNELLFLVRLWNFETLKLWNFETRLNRKIEKCLSSCDDRSVGEEPTEIKEIRQVAI